jgi:MerR family redox-sensitive transcriptional activator SoxR
MEQLTLSEVAHRVGLNPSALRYYERVGLISRRSRVNGQRRYAPDVVRRLALIRMAQEAGFSLEEAATLVGAFPDDTPPAERWQELAHRKLPEVDDMIRRMQIVRQVLEESLQCDYLTLDACAEAGWSTLWRVG